MFIDVTRYGGLRILRLQVSAIAYLDGVEGGAAIHLIGGETLRVNEDPGEIEARCFAPFSPVAAPAPKSEEPAREEADPPAEPAEPEPEPEPEGPGKLPPGAESPPAAAVPPAGKIKKAGGKRR